MRSSYNTADKSINKKNKTYMPSRGSTVRHRFAPFLPHLFNKKCQKQKSSQSFHLLFKVNIAMNGFQFYNQLYCWGKIHTCTREICKLSQKTIYWLVSTVATVVFPLSLINNAPFSRHSVCLTWWPLAFFIRKGCLKLVWNVYLVYGKPQVWEHSQDYA
jgi:hypothetical protein